MITIRLLDARRGLHSKCVELFKDAKIAESIYRFLCDGIEDCDYAESERKRGKWIKSNESALRPYMCSECGALFDVDTVLGKLSWQYCPACGTEMEG